MTDPELIDAFGQLRVLSTTIIGFRHLCYDADKPYGEAARIEHFAHFVAASGALAEAVIELADALSDRDDRRP